MTDILNLLATDGHARRGRLTFDRLPVRIAEAHPGQRLGRLVSFATRLEHAQFGQPGFDNQTRALLSFRGFVVLCLWRSSVPV